MWEVEYNDEQVDVAAVIGLLEQFGGLILSFPIHPAL